MPISMPNMATDTSASSDGPLLLTLLMGNNNNNAQAQAQADAFPDTLSPQNYALERKFSRSYVETDVDIEPSARDEDRPLLSALMLGSNNNDASATSQISAIPDTLNPRYFALEHKSERDSIQEHINSAPTSVLEMSEDGPLLLGLLLTNQNNNNPGNPPVPETLDPRNIALELSPSESDSRKIDGSSVGSHDGPLLLTLLLNNQNQNNDAPAGNAIPDTLHPSNYTLELNAPKSNGSLPADNASDEDGLLLLTNLLTNQNQQNNSAANAIPDTLDTRSFALELDPGVRSGQTLPVNSTSRSEEGPILFALLLNNQNNNNRIDNSENPISDTLSPKNMALELLLPKNGSDNNGDVCEPLTTSSSSTGINLNSGDTISEAIPDAMKLKSQLLQLHTTAGLITEAIPVVFNVRAANKNTREALTQQTLSKAPIVNDVSLKSGTSLAPKTSVISDETQKGRLSNEQLQFWRDNGYLVIPNALPSDQLDLLLATVHDAAGILAHGGERVQKHSYLPGQESYVSPCGRAIASLSECAFTPNVPPLKRIQRIGCGIHRVMPAFRKTILSPFHTTLAQSLGYTDPRIFQSLIIVKAAEVGARVIPHQDGCSGFTDPPSCTTFWYALEDATAENGCLAVAPGSHRTQPLTRRCRSDKLGMPEFVDLETPVFAKAEGVLDTSLPRRNEAGELEYRKLEVQAGSLVLMHGNLMHTSEANCSSKNRVAFNFGVVDGRNRWLEDNYLQPYEGTTEFERLDVR